MKDLPRTGEPPTRLPNGFKLRICRQFCSPQETRARNSHTRAHPLLCLPHTRTGDDGGLPGRKPSERLNLFTLRYHCETTTGGGRKRGRVGGLPPFKSHVYVLTDRLLILGRQEWGSRGHGQTEQGFVCYAMVSEWAVVGECARQMGLIRKVAKHSHTYDGVERLSLSSSATRMTKDIPEARAPRPVVSSCFTDQ